MTDDELFDISSIPDIGETCEDLYKAAEKLADIVKAAELTTEPSEERAGFIPVENLEECEFTPLEIYLSTITGLELPNNFIKEIIEAYQRIMLYGGSSIQSMQEAFEEIRKCSVDAQRKAETERRGKPPKHVPALGLSPPQTKYWINYKARDRLPAKGMKTPAIRRKRV